MLSRKTYIRWVVATWLTTASVVAAPQDVGSIRGVVYDKDFDGPLSGVEILNLRTEQKVQTTDQGNYVFPEVPTGTYTLVFSKDGYVRQVRADVVVQAGQLTEVEMWLPGDFTDMEEFVVEDGVGLGTGSEAALLELRLESPSLLDSVSADLMSKAGASDAAGALRLVAGATVKDDNTAVIRGLPDRYVASLLNGVRLPSAVEEKRAVELDQFPAAVIESIQVSKTFTPDQQGDASGGAVDVRLKGIPKETNFFVKAETKYNTQVTGIDDFLTYNGGGVNFLGSDDGRRIQYENLGQNWDGAVGVSEGNAPFQGKFAFGGGSSWELNDDWDLGVFASFSHESDAAYFTGGKSDNLWVDEPGGPLTPQYDQGEPDNGNPESGDFATSLFDVTQGTESIQWSGLGLIGLESENHFLGINYLYSRSAQDQATLAENTRGKYFYFPDHDPSDQNSPGHGDSLDASPFLRFETLEYTERTTGSLQFNGRHALPFGETNFGDTFRFSNMELDWIVANSFAKLDQPDKRQFASVWRPGREIDFDNDGNPDIIIPPTHSGFKPSATFSLGNLQRIWKTIDEESTQYSLNMKWPFEQWNRNEGYLKAGFFDDSVDREFTQESFSNFGDQTTFNGEFEELWSAQFPFEPNHPIFEGLQDVDYDGQQDITALYGMMDLPFNEEWRVITGARFERTQLSVINDPEVDAVWFPPATGSPTVLLPGDADVDIEQNDILPSLAINYDPIDEVTIRASYSETLARQTFKELTPIVQQEFLGGPIFIGNPDLQTSGLRNYDLRLDYRPYSGSLLSVSYFYKDIDDPIEYIQRTTQFNFTYPVNYPEGYMQGIEFEARQSLGEFIEELEGLDVGANATFIDSRVTLTDEEITSFNDPLVNAPLQTRDMTGAPEHLYNLYVTYDIAPTRTQLGLFYTVQGDTLVSGAAVSDAEADRNFVPSVYAKQFDTLNFSLQQALGDYLTLTFRARNLTNPSIDTVYRSEYIDGDAVRTSFTRGIDYSLSIGARLTF